MRLSWLVGLLALLLLGGSVTGAALAARPGPSEQDPAATSARHAPSTAETDEDEADDENEGRDGAKGPKAGHGPPAWAKGHAKSTAARAGKGKDWKDAWQRLTEAERRARMEGLSKAHAQGMRAWAKCAEAAGEDRAKRSSCEKPLPPGLAKKQ